MGASDLIQIDQWIMKTFKRFYKEENKSYKLCKIAHGDCSLDEHKKEPKSKEKHNWKSEIKWLSTLIFHYFILSSDKSFSNTQTKIISLQWASLVPVSTRQDCGHFPWTFP